MNRIRTFFMLAVVAGFLAPAATAAWSGFGDLEPNSVYDSPDVMYQDADTTTDGKQIYLNAFSASGLWLTSQNPNNAATGSRVYPTGTLYFYAALGIWKDCNNDGYMGMAEGALVTYRAELLASDSICSSLNSPHNDGQWVTELLAIGMVDPCEGAAEADKLNPDHPCSGFGDWIQRPGVFYANGTRLWADIARPLEPHGGGASCPIRPHDRGTTSNTGMMLRAVDCILAYRIANTVNDVDSNDELGLYFDDPRNPHHSDSLLAQNLPVSTFGNPNNGQTGLLEQGTGKPTATVWSCNGGQGSPSVGTASNPTDSSAFDAADYALDGVTIGAAEGRQVVGTYNTVVRPVLNGVVTGTGISKNPDFFREVVVAWNDCDSSTRTELYDAYYDENLYGQDPSGAGLIEGKNSPTPAEKTEASFVYEFWDGGFDPRDADNKVILDTFGARTPPDFGVGATASLFGPIWSANTIYISSPQLINRATLGASAASYWTTYAYVATDSEYFPAGATFPGNGVTFTYGNGEKQCNGATSGIVNGWNCDPAEWWKDSNGKDTRDYYSDDVTPLGGSVHDPYQLRDTECYDGTIVDGVFVRASLVDLHQDGPCDGNAPFPV